MTPVHQLLSTGKRLAKHAYIRGVILLSAPASVQNPEFPVEVHIVACHRDAFLLIYTVKQFLRHLGLRLPIIIHDDGTLTWLDKAAIHYHLRGVVIANFSVTFQKIASVHNLKARYPNAFALKTGRYGTNRLNGIRIIDIPFTAATEKILLVDTDIIFYRKPHALIKWIKNPNDRSMFFMKDQASYYALPENILATVAGGRKIHTEVNCGLLGLTADSMAPAFIERWLRDIFHNFERLNLPLHKRIFIDQDVTVCSFSTTRQKVSPLPDTYFLWARNAWNRTALPKNSVCIHFSGPFKTELYDAIFHHIRGK